MDKCVIKGCDQPVCPFFNIGKFPPQRMRLCVDHNPYIKNEENREFYKTLNKPSYLERLREIDRRVEEKFGPKEEWYCNKVERAKREALEDEEETVGSASQKGQR